MKKKLQFNSVLLILLFVVIGINAQSTSTTLPNSVLSDNDDDQVLTAWLKKNNLNPAGTLLYRRSRDGASATSFHNKVDNKGATLVIFKANNGTVFGGYNPNSWNRSNTYSASSEAFLFNLTTNKRGLISALSTQNATFNQTNGGPAFGAGYDIQINSTMDGGYFFPGSYNSLDGGVIGSLTAIQALTGVNTLVPFYSFGPGFITEIEVYGIRFIQNSGPIIRGKNITVMLDANGQVNITPQDIDTGTTDSDGPVTLSIDVDSFNCSDIADNPGTPTTSIRDNSQDLFTTNNVAFSAPSPQGNNSVTLTATDPLGNSSSRVFKVTVLDNSAPVLSTQDIVVDLDENGVAIFTQQMIDNGTTDNCGIDNISISNDRFSCNDLGEQFIVFTATDLYGNTVSKNVKVTVRDTIAPQFSSTETAFLLLDENGIATYDTSTFNADSVSDNCEIDRLEFDRTTFNCNELGEQVINVTAFDTAGNSTVGQILIDVRDEIIPTIITQNITVNLDENGLASIVPSDIDNGSFDNCNLTFALDITEFSCTNLGENIVTLTGTDTNGVSISEQATVTVVSSSEIESNGNGNFNSDGNPLPNQDKVRTFTINNTGTSNLNVTNIFIDGTDAEFFNINGDTTATISAGNSFTFDVTFNAPNITTYSAFLRIESSDCDEPITTYNLEAEITCLAADFSTFPEDITINSSDDSCSSTLNYSVETIGNPEANLTYVFTGATSGNGEGSGTGSTFNVGTTVVTLNVTNACGNQTKSFTVTVKDVTAPTVGTKNISVSLDENGNATINPEDVLILSEDDVETDQSCEVSAAEYHAVYLSKYKYKSWYWKNGENKEQKSSNETSARHWYTDAKFVFVENSGRIVKNLDGTASVTGILVNRKNSYDKWEVNLKLKNKMDWNSWSDLGRSWKGNRWEVRDEYKNWMYYEMDESSKLIGLASNRGKEMPISHAPSSLKYGFQLGKKANLKNGKFGLSGWFYYKNRYGKTAQGDFNLDVSECDNSPIPGTGVLTADNCEIDTYTLDQDAFSCDDIGENTVNVSVTDKSGNVTTKEVIVTVLGEKPSVSIEDFSTVSGQKKNTIFLGYAESVHLCPIVSGGTDFTYEWTDDSGNVFSTERLPKVSPKVSTTYNVKVTNSNGCSSTASIDVCVIDARGKDKWGRYNGKVTICHHTYGKKGTKHVTITISKNAVDKHLSNHGEETGHSDSLGACNATCISAEDINDDEPEETSESIYAYPNPSSGVFNVKLKNFDGKVYVKLYNMYGSLVQYRKINCTSDNVRVQMGHRNLREGAYIIKVLSSKKAFTKTMIIERNIY